MLCKQVHWFMVSNQDRDVPSKVRSSMKLCSPRAGCGVGCGKRAGQEVNGHGELRSTSAVALLLQTNNGSRLHTPFVAILELSASAILSPFLLYLPTEAGTLAPLPPPDTPHLSHV